MQNPTWFDQSYYLSLKLAQLQQTDPTMTMFNMEKAIADAGYTPYEHFVDFGAGEGLSPNAMFNMGEYLQAKANQLNAAGGNQFYTPATVLSAFEKAEVSPWEHYVQYGSNEGVNPSNAFDEGSYLTLKLAQLKALDPAKWGEWTENDVRDAFAEAGTSALQHYKEYGVNEKLVSDETQLAAKNPVPPVPVQLPGAKLTEEQDTVPGSSANELFTGNDKTWTTGDSIDGAGGTDILRLQNVSTITTDTQTVKNVEVLELSNLGTVDVVADVAHFVGLNKVSVQGAKDAALTLDKSVKEVTLSNITGKDVDVTGDGVTRMTLTSVKDGDAVVTLNNTTADHSLTLLLNTVGDMKGDNGVEIIDATAKTVSVITSGMGSAVDLTTVKATDLNISGSAELYIGNDLTGKALERVNASAMKGDLTIEASLGTAIAFTGGMGADDITVGATTKAIATGAGDDAVTLLGSSVGKDGSIDGGAGNDLLGMSFADAAAVGKGFTNQVKNFEELLLGGNAVDGAKVDMDMFAANNAFTSVVVEASTKDFTLANLADKARVELTGDMAEGVTLLVKDASSVGHNMDTLNLILGVEAAGVDVGSVVVTDLENLNITSQGGANVIDSLGGLSSNGVVTITGDTALNLTTGAMGVAATFDAKDFAADLTLDASLNSKDLKITGGKGNDTLTGGAGKDVIEGGAGNDIIKSSAGTDKLTGGTGTDSFVYDDAADSVATALDVITDFTHSQDKLDLSGLSAVAATAAELTAVQTAVKGLAAGSSLTDALDAASKALTTDNKVAWFEFSGKTYVYQESTGADTAYDATDLVIELTGTDLGITASDIVFA